MHADPFILKNGLWVPSLLAGDVRTGTILVSNGNASATSSAFAAVDLANSRLALVGINTQTPLLPRWVARLTMTSTQVTATRGGPTEDVTYTFRVTPYSPGLWRSIQRVTVTILAGLLTGTQAITEVDPNRCEVVWLGSEFQDADEDILPTFDFASSTSIRATMAGSSGADAKHEVEIAYPW